VISFRYHLVSIIGIFLAVALGVVIGTSALNGAVVGDLHRQVKDLKASNATADARNKALAAQAGNADILAKDFGGKIAAGALAGKSVVILSAPGADSSIAQALAAEVPLAGGKVSAQLQLSADFTDPSRAVDIKSLATSGVHPNGLQYPVTTDAGRLAGSLLGYVLLGHGQPTDLTQVLTGFSTLKMIKTVSGTTAAGNVLLLVAPGALVKTDPSTAELLSMTSQLAATGGPTVIVGDGVSASQNGLVGLARADAALKQAASTVDNADTDLGQLSAMLVAARAIGGHPGQFGTGVGADALIPGASQ
jgi:hypothetical protein